MFYRKYRKIILPALFLPLFLIVWELYIRLFHVPNYLLPGPAELADSMVKLFVSGDIMKHIRVTMEEILMGTVIGIVIGLILGYIMAKIRFIERLIMPFVIIIQTPFFLRGLFYRRPPRRTVLRIRNFQRSVP